MEAESPGRALQATCSRPYGAVMSRAAIGWLLIGLVVMNVAWTRGCSRSPERQAATRTRPEIGAP